MTQEKNISAFYSEMNAFNKRIILVADEIQNIERIQMFRDIFTIHVDDDISLRLVVLMIFVVMMNTADIVLACRGTIFPWPYLLKLT